LLEVLGVQEKEEFCTKFEEHANRISDYSINGMYYTYDKGSYPQDMLQIDCGRGWNQFVGIVAPFVRSFIV
jgi:hypothetical protein